MNRAVDAAILITAVLWISSLAGPVHAYLDPGTGSMVIQVILGGIVGALTLAKVYWRRISVRLGRRAQDPLADD